MTHEMTRRSAIGACVAGGLLTLSACASPTPFTELDPGTGGSATFPLDDIEIGGAGSLQIDRNAIIVTRPSETDVHAFSGHCTHQGCLVRMQDSVIHCPCHGSEFDPATGGVLEGPAIDPLPRVSAEVADGQVTVTIG